ncbi:hypothetical protein K1T71_007949 [Dendrolimus kikuchii]|uniref:Uncharacterized protein n=1 Tax=Dendrolimus kikuchii TaxID=765133 RepID=A0ACC1CYX9_9NEOP|nr:hypothetical protein K1T71_007949 [Dendrolimus kikuchii]
MKSLIVAICLVGCALAGTDYPKVVRSDYQQSPEGNFQYVYETENGIAGQAEGKLKSFGKDESAIEITGSSQYKSADGKVYALSYVADENGYHPQADFLPTPPAPEPLPEHVVRSLAYIAAHPYVEKKKL